MFIISGKKNSQEKLIFSVCILEVTPFVSFGHAKAVTDGEGGEERGSHNWSHDVCGDEQRKNLGKTAEFRANMASLQSFESKWLVNLS